MRWVRFDEQASEIRVSDLYAMNWKAIADVDDFPQRNKSLPLEYMTASGEAYKNGTQARDTVAEQEKLLWADAVALQFRFGGSESPPSSRVFRDTKTEATLIGVARASGGQASAPFRNGGWS